MDGMEVFGVIAFIFSSFALMKIIEIENKLKESGVLDKKEEPE